MKKQIACLLGLCFLVACASNAVSGTTPELYRTWSSQSHDELLLISPSHIKVSNAKGEVLVPFTEYEKEKGRLYVKDNTASEYNIVSVNADSLVLEDYKPGETTVFVPHKTGWSR